MKLSDDGAKLIKHFEACKLIAYPDPGTGAAPWTCGWGSTGTDIFDGVVWSQAYADQRFLDDSVPFEQAVEKCVLAPLTQAQFDALVSLAYNIGPANLRGSTLMRKLNERDYATAASEFVRWNRAAGQIMRGLTRRRYAERALFEGELVDEAIRIGTEAA
jgi:lysozyme